MWLYLSHTLVPAHWPNITTYFNHQLQMDVQQLATMYEHVNAVTDYVTVKVRYFKLIYFTEYKPTIYISF